MEDKTEKETMSISIESGTNVNDILNVLRDVQGEAGVKAFVAEARKTTRRINKEDKQKYLDSKSSEIMEIQNTVKSMVSELFKDIPQNEDICLDVRVISKPNFCEAMSKTKHNILRQPLIFTPEGNEGDMDSFRNFGKKTYKTKKSD